MRKDDMIRLNIINVIPGQRTIIIIEISIFFILLAVSFVDYNSYHIYILISNLIFIGVTIYVYSKFCNVYYNSKFFLVENIIGKKQFATSDFVKVKSSLIGQIMIIKFKNKAFFYYGSKRKYSQKFIWYLDDLGIEVTQKIKKNIGS